MAMDGVWLIGSGEEDRIDLAGEIFDFVSGIVSHRRRLLSLVRLAGLRGGMAGAQDNGAAFQDGHSADRGGTS